MNVNSVADGVAAFKLPAFKPAIQLRQSVKNTAETVVPAIVQEGPSKVADAFKVPAPVGVSDKTPVVREMSNITESYDARGKVITKFMDSSNNVIYQTPSESVIKTQELMTNTQAATNIKG